MTKIVIWIEPVRNSDFDGSDEAGNQRGKSVKLSEICKGVLYLKLQVIIINKKFC